jgi:hypothetical protein
MVLFLASIANFVSQFFVKVLKSDVVLDELWEVPSRNVVENALLMEASYLKKRILACWRSA